MSPSRFNMRYVGASALLLASITAAYPQLQDQWAERRIEERQVQAEYDYIVVGGGQSGLVVANRLSEDKDSTVLVVEYGYLDNDTQVLQPSSAVRYPRKNMYNVTSLPQPGLGNTTQTIYAAAVVGGGSTINGMMLNRGAADDYDNWEKLGNPGWGWNSLLPYFVKSTTFQAPSPALREEYNITWNTSSYGDKGPIKVSYAPYQWPGVKIQYRGVVETGCVPQLDGADGNAFGVFWYTSAVDNRTITRSYARNEYYDPVAGRANLALLTGWRVNEVKFEGEAGAKKASGITMQPRGSPNGDASVVTFVKARKEIIVTAGSLHSPQVLQRSGIGPKALLEKARIPLVVDLPGVGSNLQDHPVGSISFRYTTNVWPNPEDARTNNTFNAWAQDEWTRNRLGPLSQTTGNTAALVPLTVVSPTGWQSIVDEYRAQKPGSFLPVDYTAEQIAGYEKQRALLADSMSRDDNAVVEYPLSASGSGALVITKEVSRGTVLLDPKDIYGEPFLDYNTFINPVDVRIAAANIRWVRRVHQTQALRQLSPTEQTPGANITSEADLLATVRRGTSSSTAHISGSCAMMPRELGGVVGPDLLVHGVTGLSVADSSIMPLIPGAHICTSVYAVAEKAADLIKARHSVKRM